MEEIRKMFALLNIPLSWGKITFKVENNFKSLKIFKLWNDNKLENLKTFFTWRTGGLPTFLSPSSNKFKINILKSLNKIAMKTFL
jgi:hypothetical protein